MPMPSDPRANSALPRSACRSSYIQSVRSELMHGTNAVPGRACADRISAEEDLSQTGVLIPSGLPQPGRASAVPRTATMADRRLI